MGKSVAADYVDAMEFDGDRIQHMTKIWNGAHLRRQFGWTEAVRTIRPEASTRQSRTVVVTKGTRAGPCGTACP